MSDIKLFRLKGESAEELTSSSFPMEKGLQSLVERNLPVLLGIRFLASEHSTGKTHAGRIDTLGIDENYSPVIIEYKRSTNENVINQGLFYLDWLMDHRAEFALLAMKVLGADMEPKIDWSAPRLLCIARDFTRYDEHAVQQIDRNIELLRYRNYESGFFVLELVNATTASSPSSGNGAGTTAGPKTPRSAKATVDEYLQGAPQSLKDLFQTLEAFLLSLGDDVTRKDLKYYFAFRRLKNFACVEIHKQTHTLLLYLKVDPTTVELREGFTRDVRSIGHYGTGELEVRVKSLADLEAAKPLLERSYEAT